jgi:hypothetical protein
MKALNIVIWSFIQCILTFVLFCVYVSNSSYSGGEVGMTPLSVALASIIQLVISVCCAYLVSKYFTNNSPYLLFLSNMIIYQFAFTIFSMKIPLFGIFEGGVLGFLNKGYTFSSMVSCLIIVLSYWLISGRRTKSTSTKLDSAS